jgi:hypothetical protein
MGLTSIAFPALGTGAAGIPPATAAAGMVDVIAGFLSDCPAELSVELRLHARRGVNERDFVTFYELLAKQAPGLEQAAVPPQPAARWEAHQRQQAPALALEQQRVDLERQLEDAVLVGDKPRLTQVLDELAKNVQQRTDAAAVQRSSSTNAVSVFISYAHEDEGSRQQLGRGLATLTEKGLIREWHDRNLLPGDRYNTEIADALNTADLALFLISPDFISSDYINGIELRRAYEREKAGELKIVPVFVRKTYLVEGHPLRDFTSVPVFVRKTYLVEGHPLRDFTSLPTDRKAITSWANQDEAYYDVVTGIARLVKEIAAKPPAELSS